MIESCTCTMCNEERAQMAAQQPKVEEVPTSRALTREMFMKGHPCYIYRTRFIERFPVSVEVTAELAVSQADDWDWWWAAYYLLSKAGYAEFSIRVAEVEQIYADTLAPYRAVRAALQSEAEKQQMLYRDKLHEDGVPYYDAEDKSYILYGSLMRTVGSGEYYGTSVAENAAKARVEGIARVWAELFLEDKDAYEAQHKDDEPFVENDDEDEDDDY